MRLASGAILALALLCSATSADPPIRLPQPAVVPDKLPPAPPPGTVITLAPDEWYAVESDSELIILTHPADLIAWEKVEPGHFRGKFAGGSGKVESRKLKGPHVYLGTAAGKGRADIDFVPVGVKSRAEIVSATVDVDGGQGPIPPPKPKPPEPVKNVAWVVVIEETTDRTPEVAALLNDTAYWKSLESHGIKWRFYDDDSPDAKAKKYLRPGATIPYLLLLDAKGWDARDGGEPKPVELPKNKAALNALLGVK